jgi:hypothetical protein
VIAIQTLDAGCEHADERPERPFDSVVGGTHIDGYINVLKAADSARLEAIQAAGKPVVMVSNDVPGLRCPDRVA